MNECKKLKDWEKTLNPINKKMTPEDLKKEARNTLARERKADVSIDPDDLVCHIIDANPLDTLLDQAKKSYRITLDVPKETWTMYNTSSHATQYTVREALKQHYHCAYVGVLYLYGENQFELHYDQDENDLGGYYSSGDDSM